MPPPEILQAEIRELRTVVNTLRQEKRELEEQNQQLLTEMVRLNRQIRSLEENPPAAEAPPPLATPVAAQPGLHGVLYVNPTWHYLLIDAGQEAGIQKGARGSVLRNGEIIAAVTVTDTKANQSVAELILDSLSNNGVYPRKDDQVRFP
ncbi:MAG: hypothetical protein ACO3N7_09215 [Kiritimatiellia bacterium]